MHKYLLTSTMTSLPWLHPVLNFFFMNIPKIAARVLHVPSLDVTSAPVLNIIVSIKYGYVPTNSAPIGQTASWFPHKLIMPTATATNIIIATVKDLTAVLK